MTKEVRMTTLAEYGCYLACTLAASAIGTLTFLWASEKKPNLSVDQNGNTVIRNDLDLYGSTIQKISFKSNMKEKLNPVRKYLDMPERTAPIKKGQYDSEVVAKLWNRNFSSLDEGFLQTLVGWHNVSKATVLSVVPFIQGLEPAPLIGEEGIME